MADNVLQRLRSYLNPAIKGKFANATLGALAAGDGINEANIYAVKPQLFIATATGQFLDRLMAGIGVTRPPGIGISDDLFSQMGIEITNSKLVTNVFLDVLEIFYGADAIQANVLSGNAEGYVLSDGMTLVLQVDNNPKPLIVTFSAQDFDNIATASATEVANIISRFAFNSGYTLIAQVLADPTTGLNFIQLMSGTKGPKSSVTVIGGSAQNILNFPKRSLSIPRLGTQFSTSFSGQFVRFTWTSGPSPLLEFVSPGDYVNIYGAGYLSQNQGTFIIQDVQDGPLGSAYFDIINPNFVPQGAVTLTAVGGASGGGTVTATASIQPIPTGAVRSSNITTINTIGNHGFSSGQTVTIDGVDNSTFNGTYLITGVSPTSFTYNQTGANATSGGGTAAVSYGIQLALGAVRVSGVTTITTTANHNLVAGQSVNVEGVEDSSFNGIFTITAVGSNTFMYTQDASNDLVFFTPVKETIQKLARYASVYEVNPYEVVIFLPATTRIVKRLLIGSWHVHNSDSVRSFLGSYTFNPKSGFPITKTSTTLTEDIFQGELLTVGFGADTSQFPDTQGLLVFEYGSSNQEGPVKYLGRPSSGSLLLDPSYKFKKTHNAGADITLLKSISPYSPKPDGTDYQAYVTGTITGRVEAEALIQSLTASGIFLNIIVVYPQGPGLQDIQGYVYAGDPP